MEELIATVRDFLAAYEWWFGNPLIPLVAIPVGQGIVGIVLAWTCIRSTCEPGR